MGRNSGGITSSGNGGSSGGSKGATEKGYCKDGKEHCRHGAEVQTQQR